MLLPVKNRLYKIDSAALFRLRDLGFGVADRDVPLLAVKMSSLDGNASLAFGALGGLLSFGSYLSSVVSDCWFPLVIHTVTVVM